MIIQDELAKQNLQKIVFGSVVLAAFANDFKYNVD